MPFSRAKAQLQIELIILQIPYFQHAFDKTSHTGYPTASIA